MWLSHVHLNTKRLLIIFKHDEVIEILSDYIHERFWGGDSLRRRAI